MGSGDEKKMGSGDENTQILKTNIKIQMKLVTIFALW
jgi:hypothetical protein